VSGDADFVPAAKLARREGVDFILIATRFHALMPVCRRLLQLSQQPQPKNGKKFGMSPNNVLSLHQS
jgi:uncharacterized LabA/DUF88 family protein